MQIKRYMEFGMFKETAESWSYLDKLRFLEKNKEFCGKGLFRRDQYYMEHSNCWGTTIFILEAETKFVKNFRMKEIEESGILGDKGAKSESFIPSNYVRPGHVGKLHFDWFLRDYCSPVENIIQGEIIAVYKDEEVAHSMVYVGKVNGEDYVYEQNGLRGKFGFEKLNKKIRGYVHKFFRYTP